MFMERFEGIRVFERGWRIENIRDFREVGGLSRVDGGGVKRCLI